MKKRCFLFLLVACLLLSACGEGGRNGNGFDPENGEGAAGLGGDDRSFGEDIRETGAYDGYFEGTSEEITVTCLSGTQGAYHMEGTTLVFTEIAEETVYSISGRLKGCIVIDVGDAYKFDLELHGFSLVSDTQSPITVRSGDEVAIKAKKDTQNYIYDMRPTVDPDDETAYAGAIHADVDLEIGGKGSLTVISENNNGIHSKDDLEVKNLTLFVACIDNALKGNDSVEITGGKTTLIASGGDCVKSTNSDISEKGNQRGTVRIAGGTHTLYAACDGIDASYNAVIEEESTVLHIYTDKYSNYSKEVAATSSDVNYIRFTSNAHYYSVKYYNSDTDYVWVNAEYHSKVSGGRSNYYYYAYPKNPDYAKVQFFIYENVSQLGQDAEYLVMSDYLTQNTACDTFALTSSYNGLYYEWTNYTTKIQEGGFGGHGGMGGPGGMGGMGDGNTDKGEYSTKGIKAANEIIIDGGTVNIKSYDDAIHANSDTPLENGETPLGNVTVRGGSITVYSNDDGLHADGTLSVTAGSVCVTNSYEGIEGAVVRISGGSLSVLSKDDGINGTGTGDVVFVEGGSVYIYASGDGIDAGSDMSGTARIVFSGGNTVVISTSSGNSAIDSNSGFTQTAGARVLAIMPRGGMTGESTYGNAAGMTVNKSLSVSSGDFVTVEVDGSTVVAVRMPLDMTGYIVYLGSADAVVDTSSSTSLTLDGKGVGWH